MRWLEPSAAEGDGTGHGRPASLLVGVPLAQNAVHMAAMHSAASEMPVDVVAGSKAPSTELRGASERASIASSIEAMGPRPCSLSVLVTLVSSASSERANSASGAGLEAGSIARHAAIVSSATSGACTIGRGLRRTSNRPD